jgi:hypothetical protein
VSANLKHPWNLITGGLIFVGLQLALLRVSGGNSLGIEVSADLAHLIAFPLGWYSSKISRNENVHHTTEGLIP